MLKNVLFIISITTALSTDAMETIENREIVPPTLNDIVQEYITLVSIERNVQNKLILIHYPKNTEIEQKQSAKELKTQKEALQSSQKKMAALLNLYQQTSLTPDENNLIEVIKRDLKESKHISHINSFLTSVAFGCLYKKRD